MKPWEFGLLAGGATIFLLVLTGERGDPERWHTPATGYKRGIPPTMFSIQARVMEYRSIMMREGERIGLEPAVIAAVMDNEGAVEDAVTWEANVGDYSYGLMQIRGTTAEWLGYSGSREGLLDPRTNIHYGAEYLKYQWDRYHGNIMYTLAAYNAGSVKRNWLGNLVNADYVALALTKILNYRRLFNWYYPGYEAIFELVI